MKKEYNPLTICYPDAHPTTNAGDLSPHRSTLELKEWALTPEITDELVFGEPDSIPRQPLSLRRQQGPSVPFTSIMVSQFQGISFSQEKKQRCESRVRCVSNESLTEVWGHQPVVEALPITRQVSAEIQMETETMTSCEVLQQSVECKPKRRRNPSISDDVHDTLQPMEEDNLTLTPNPRKRRRLHDRKFAMDNQDFGLILAQIGM